MPHIDLTRTTTKKQSEKPMNTAQEKQSLPIFSVKKSDRRQLLIFLVFFMTAVRDVTLLTDISAKRIIRGDNRYGTYSAYYI